VLSYSVVIRYLHISLFAMAKAVWRCWLAAGIMAVIVSGAMSLAPTWLDDPWERLFGGIAIGAATYPVVLLSLWRLVGCPAGAEEMTLAALARLRGSALAALSRMRQRLRRPAVS
jgi:hypothetical protein